MNVLNQAQCDETAGDVTLLISSYRSLLTRYRDDPDKVNLDQLSLSTNLMSALYARDRTPRVSLEVAALIRHAARMGISAAKSVSLTLDRWSKEAPPTIQFLASAEEMKAALQVLERAKAPWLITYMMAVAVDTTIDKAVRVTAKKIAEKRVRDLRSFSQSLPDLIDLALETAARLGELISINPRNIDLGARTLTLTDTKNGDNRTIPLSQTATTILERRISQRGTHTDRLFDVTPHAVTIAFRRAVARARKGIDQEHSSPHHRSPDLTDIRFHDLRREATSRLVEKGLTVMETATITGHRTLEMLRRYTALRAKDMVTKLD